MGPFYPREPRPPVMDGLLRKCYVCIWYADISARRARTLSNEKLVLRAGCTIEV